MKNSLCLSGKDVARIAGKSVRYGCKVLSDIRKKLKKPKGACVTLKMLCNHLGIDYEEAESYYYGKTG